MWITQLRVTSYYSFDDSGWVDLSPDINLFVGANNSGKTALLRCLSQNFVNVPHRNTVRFRGTDLAPSRVDLDVAISWAELVGRHRSEGSTPTFPGTPRDAKSVGDALSDENAELVIEATRQGRSSFSPRDNASLASFRYPGEQTAFNLERREAGWVAVSSTGINATDNLSEFLNFQNEPAIFYFEPQRLHVGSVQFSEQRRLNPDASNLPAVLFYLQGARPNVFDRVVRHVVEVSQSVRVIRAAPSGGNVEILIWPTENTERSEFAFTLNESGTGIGQILAIITAAATSEQSVIVIDEINTFLHPAATKRLLSILRSEYPHHQYIISTHSSDVISHVAAEKTYLVQKEGYESRITLVEPNNIRDLRSVANELGFSMMDVFGHDRLIWVEGETELIVFPLILRAVGDPLPPGIGISTVASAAEFDPSSRSSRSIIEMYEHVATRVGPLLKGLAFGLDREGHSDEAVAKLETSKRKLRFLPRRCLECYLLDPEAIAVVINAADSGECDAAAVLSFLTDNGADRKYRARSVWNGNLDHPEWLKKVDAALLLSDCFAKLTANRTEFRKTRDSVALASYLLRTKPERLTELADYIKKLVEIARRDSRA
jgi:ABC-type cobalamin/Fe3+-siderophores transport system ATPase subunit